MPKVWHKEKIGEKFTLEKVLIKSTLLLENQAHFQETLTREEKYCPSNLRQKNFVSFQYYKFALGWNKAK